MGQLVLDTDPGRCVRLVELLSGCPGARVLRPTPETLALASPYRPPAALRRVVLETAAGAAGADVLRQLCAIESLGRYVHKMLPVCGSCGGRQPDEAALLAAILDAVCAARDGIIVTAVRLHTLTGTPVANHTHGR